MIHLPELSHTQSIGLVAITVVGCARYVRYITRAISDVAVCVIDEIGRVVSEFHRIRNEINRERQEAQGQSHIRLKGRRAPSPPQRLMAPPDDRRAGRTRTQL